MFPYLKNDHIKYSGVGYTFKLDLYLPTVFESHYLESLKAAKEIWDLKVGDIHILLSGGADSDYAVRVFHHLGMKVIPVIIRLQPNYNDHETKYAFDLCNEKGLVPIVFDIDFDKFVSSGKIVEMAYRYNSPYHYYSVIHSILPQLTGTVIMAANEPHIRLDVKDNTWNFHEYNADVSLLKCYKEHGIPGTPYFFKYTAEQAAAYLSSTRMRELADNKHPGKLSSNSSKIIIYNEDSGFNLPYRSKFTGYEIIETGEIFKHDVMKEFSILSRLYYGEYIENYHVLMKRFNIL